MSGMSGGGEGGGDPRRAILERIAAAEPVAGAGAGTAAPAPPEAVGSEASHSGGGGGEPGYEGAGAWDLKCARLPLTDLGNAQRFVLRHGDAFCWVPEWGWLAWDGRRWDRDGADGLVARAVHGTVMAIAAEARALADSGDDWTVDVRKGLKRSDKIRAWGLSSQANAHISCMARLVQPYLQAAPDDFDADPMLLNVANGTLRFARGTSADDEGDYVTFHPHDRADRITRLAPVDYDPDAACPVYDAALARVQPDDGMRRHLHCWGGVSLTGDVSLQRMAFWYGKGGNMKSTLLDAWAHVAGARNGGYATTVGVETFLDQGRTRRGGDATPDLADLIGVRMLKTTEPERGAKLAEALIKTATGDEHLKVRFLNKDFFPLRVQFHLTMFGNTKPSIAGTDDGIWRRVAMVPWLVQVPAEERDRELLGKLKGEASGILNRLLDGIRDYLDNGLVEPEAVIKATSDFRVESDPLGRFMEVCLEHRDGARVQSSVLYRLYQAWCVANGEKAWTPTGFGKALSERGLRRKQSSVMYWLDVAMTRSVYDFVTEPEAPPERWRAKRQDGGDEAPATAAGESLEGGGDDA